ncbi:MAG: ferritin family protein [Oscillospiraceae bacterium]
MSLLLADSETKTNLMRAFAGESQARNRYTFAAELAKTQQYEVLEKVFLFTADQEKAHAKVFMDFLTPLSGKNLPLDGTYPVDSYPDVLDHLKAARQHELDEFSDVYPAFSAVAAEEGFDDIADAFGRIALIEKTHAHRFGHLAELLEQKKLFVSDAETGWICLNCGTIVNSTAAPTLCPVCKHNQGFFVRLQFSPYLCSGCFK